jgi:hypothetical protein
MISMSTPLALTYIALVLTYNTYYTYTDYNVHYKINKHLKNFGLIHRIFFRCFQKNDRNL